MKRVIRGSTAAASALAMWFSGAPMANAADKVAAATGELEEVVVTAEKRETNLQKTAISIQTYSGDELKKNGKRRIDEIMGGVVGVAVTDSQVGNDFYMRGVDRGTGGGAPGGTPTAPAVSVIIDGIYQNRGETVRGGALDVSQVEVMRGSQSTTVGANALAGAVSLVTNSPVFEYQANGSIEVGNFNTRNLEGVVNVPFGSRQAVRVAISKNDRDGFISSNAGNTDLLNARVKYRFKASDTLDFVVTGSRNKIGGNGVQAGVLLTQGHWVPYTGQTFLNTAGTAQVNIYPTAGSCVQATTANGTRIGNTLSGVTGMGCPPSFVPVYDGIYYFDRNDPWDDGFPKNAFPNGPFRDTVVDSVSTDINWDTSIGKLTVTPSIQRATFRSKEPPRGTSWMEEDRVQSTRQFEARLASKQGSRLSWLVGAYYYYTNNTGTFRNVFFPGASYTPGPAVGATTTAAAVNCPVTATGAALAYCSTWQNQLIASQYTRSLYTNLSFPITDRFRLLGGLRYQVDVKRTAGTVDGALNPVAGSDTAYIDNPAVYYDFGGKWNNTQYRAGIEFDVRPQSMFYATFQTGYQPGAVSPMTASMSAFAVTSAAPSAPLKLYQTTLGIKNQFLDNRIRFNVEAWNSDFRDRATTFPGVAFLTNDGTLVATGTLNCGTSNSSDPTGTFRSAITATDACLTVGGNIVNTLSDQLSRGVDIELSFLPTADDRIDLTVEYLKSKYKNAPHMTGQDALTAPTVANVLAIANYAAGLSAASASAQAKAQQLVDSWNASYAAFNNLVLAGSSERSATLNYQHTFRFKGGSSLVPRLSLSYRSDYWLAGGGGQRSIQDINAFLNDSSLAFVPGVQRAFTKYDVNVQWTSANNKYTVSSYVHNAGNKATIQNSTPSYTSLDQPRTIGVILNASY